MALDVQALRSAVSAAVRDWALGLVRAGPPLGDPRAERWLESLIRYRLREPGAAPPTRGAIPGATGIAELGEAVAGEQEEGALEVLCWPASDNAVYGWGDPYTAQNAPLGTVQTSFSDTAGIARNLNDLGGLCYRVTHGVNAIAAPRDWRGYGSPESKTAGTIDFVLSWDAGAIYSGGAEVLDSTATILAAALMYVCDINCIIDPVANPPAPYLVYATNDGKIRQRSVTLSEDGKAIATVSGTETFCSFAFASNSSYWFEFSQDGEDIASTVFGITSRKVYSGTLITFQEFSGNTVTSTLEAEKGNYSLTYIADSDFNGSVSYPVKGQYVDNVLKIVWLALEIEEDSSETNSAITYLDGGDGSTAYCVDCPDSTFGETGVDHVGYVVNEIDDFSIIKAELKVGTEVFATIYPRDWHDVLTRKSWTDLTEGLECSEGALPLPAGVPTQSYGTYCRVEGFTDIEQAFLGEQSSWLRVPVNAIDIRNATNRVTVLSLGYLDASRVEHLKVTHWRDGAEGENAQISGDFGEITWPDLDTVTNTTDLQNALDSTATKLIDGELSRDEELRSVDLNDSTALTCAWASDADAAGATKYVSLMECQDILTLLSIDDEPNARIILEDEDRYFGMVDFPAAAS